MHEVCPRGCVCRRHYVLRFQPSRRRASQVQIAADMTPDKIPLTIIDTPSHRAKSDSQKACGVCLCNFGVRVEERHHGLTPRAPGSHEAAGSIRDAAEGGRHCARLRRSQVRGVHRLSALSRWCWLIVPRARHARMSGRPHPSLGPASVAQANDVPAAEQVLAAADFEADAAHASGNRGQQDRPAAQGALCRESRRPCAVCVSRCPPPCEAGGVGRKDIGGVWRSGREHALGFSALP